MVNNKWFIVQQQGQFQQELGHQLEVNLLSIFTPAGLISDFSGNIIVSVMVC